MDCGVAGRLLLSSGQVSTTVTSFDDDCNEVTQQIDEQDNKQNLGRSATAILIPLLSSHAPPSSPRRPHSPAAPHGSNAQSPPSPSRTSTPTTSPIEPIEQVSRPRPKLFFHPIPTCQFHHPSPRDCNQEQDPAPRSWDPPAGGSSQSAAAGRGGAGQKGKVWRDRCLGTVVGRGALAGELGLGVRWFWAFGERRGRETCSYWRRCTQQLGCSLTRSGRWAVGFSVWVLVCGVGLGWFVDIPIEGAWVGSLGTVGACGWFDLVFVCFGDVWLF